ncbi:hypothetical protein L402_03889 [Enterobacter asburiae]|uniref:Uncharacterized protein n=1 Tax=Enterobacter asburiae TaxID=61645 RepID=A0ABC9U8V6_ENTAS|nr:hypothetical protein L402_03889 [Enterobacter asburiae]CAE7086225.1 hypothetical protein AI2694V1_2273 [Enterobacter cloacae]CAE7482047.1 hypothetical protein AI2674V1_2263 [Enterobacter cloacae]CAE7510243.1 hypothetical protein AI2679V1_2276 [Enterobacter cloacae]CAH3685943.1 hypothetical protein AI2679V1_2276 [Enterobacter cloacae]
MCFALPELGVVGSVARSNEPNETLKALPLLMVQEVFTTGVGGSFCPVHFP